MKIKIALDIAVGRKRKKKLIDLGYDVVVTANDSEPDDKWLNRAFAAGAIFAISPDADIPRLIEVNEYPMAWIDYPNDNASSQKKDLVKYISKRIEFKMRFFKSFSEKPSKKVQKGFFSSLVFKVKRFLNIK